MNRTIFTLIFLFFTIAWGRAVPLENLVNSTQAQRLRNGDLIVQTHFRNIDPVLLPTNNDLISIVNSARRTLNPNIVVESLFLYRKPERFHTDVENWDARQRAGVFNQLLAISTLTGVQYYSASRSELRTFYEFSGVVDGPRTRRPLPDPIHALPVPLTLFARQIDLTFGENIYRYDYTVTGEAVIFTQVNETSLSYGIIPVIGRGNLQSVMAVIDCGDSILIYAISMVNAVSLPGMRDRIIGSFTSRAEAILKWYTGRLDTQLFS